MKVIVLGAGLVGAPMAIDLAKDFNMKVSSVDIDINSLEKLQNYPIETIQEDLSNAGNIESIVRDSDFVINALPGFMGYKTLKSVIESRKNIVDISFFPEDPLKLNELAKRNNVTAIVDCGVAPGLSNLLVGSIDNSLDKIENLLIYVGGLPKIREWPYEYKAVFSPADVIEEYTRPARYIENGILVNRPALSDSEYLHFSEVGTLEAFNSDGLRTLIDTISADNMKEKTLRYPGHIEKMAVLREGGFFSKEKIEINGVKISPLEFTSKILFPNWELKEEDRDITIMRIIIEGLQKNQRIRYVYDLYDQYNESTNTHSMARTTGYTGTAALRMLANGYYKSAGIIPPEFIGKNKKCVDFIINDLKMKNVIVKETIERL